MLYDMYIYIHMAMYVMCQARHVVYMAMCIIFPSAFGECRQSWRQTRLEEMGLGASSRRVSSGIARLGGNLARNRTILRKLDLSQSSGLIVSAFHDVAKLCPLEGATVAFYR